MTEHRIEMEITFEGGSGMTHVVSPEVAWFTTRHPLDIGQRIAGTLYFPPMLDGLATVLRFAARVAVVVPSLEDDDAFEVWARFERIVFEAIIAERRNSAHAAHGAALASSSSPPSAGTMPWCSASA